MKNAKTGGSAPWQISATRIAYTFSWDFKQPVLEETSRLPSGRGHQLKVKPPPPAQRIFASHENNSLESTTRSGADSSVAPYCINCHRSQGGNPETVNKKNTAPIKLAALKTCKGNENIFDINCHITNYAIFLIPPVLIPWHKSDCSQYSVSLPSMAKRKDRRLVT